LREDNILPYGGERNFIGVTPTGWWRGGRERKRGKNWGLVEMLRVEKKVEEIC